MVAVSAASAIRRRLDKTIVRLLAAGYRNLRIRLTQADEEELCQNIRDDLDAGVPYSCSVLKDGKYLGFPRAITDAKNSYIQYGESVRTIASSPIVDDNEEDS